MSIVYLTIVFRFPKSNLAQVSVFKWNLCWPILHCTLFSLLRRIIKHRKMKESKKTTFPNPLSISKNSINCYSVMYWILNLHARILLCKHSDLAILFFFFQITCMLPLVRKMQMSFVISMAESVSKWRLNAITDTNIHFNHFSILLSLHVDNGSISKYSFWSYTGDFGVDSNFLYSLCHLILLVVTPLHFDSCFSTRLSLMGV